LENSIIKLEKSNQTITELRKSESIYINFLEKIIIMNEYEKNGFNERKCLTIKDVIIRYLIDVKNNIGIICE
jgi:hypothetical protein